MYIIKEKDLSKLYQIKIRKGKDPHTARYEVEMMRKLIKKYGKTTSGKQFKFNKDAFLDYDEDGIMNAFDCQPLNRLRQGKEHFYKHKDFSSSFTFITNPEKYEITTQYMTPDEFMELAKKASIGSFLDEGKSNEEFVKEVLRPEKISEYSEAFKKGNKFPQPFLGFRKDSVTPYRHEGRHRAAAFKLAYPKKKIPVYVLKEKLSPWEM